MQHFLPILLGVSLYQTIAIGSQPFARSSIEREESLSVLPRPCWVFFRDKGGPSAEAAAIANLATTYNPRAIHRRQLRRTDAGLFDFRDLPIPSSHRDAVAQLAEIRVESRWNNAISVNASQSQIDLIRQLPFVARVETVRVGRLAEGAVSCVEPSSAYSERDFYGRSSAQLSQIGINALHDRGFTGQGVVIGILDTGFHRVHNVFNNAAHPLNIIAERDFINNDNNTGIEAIDPPDQHTHGTLILSCIGSYLPGEMVGGAYDASFILCKTEVVPTETQIEEDYYAAGIEFIEFHGGDVATSSLGYIDWYTQGDLDGHTAVTTIAINTATANGLHCCTAAGNAGHDDNPTTSHLGAPADALQVIACGATNIVGQITGFSSDGPSADGRVKPELLACGRSTACVDPNSVTAFATASGTSLSTPLVASAVACLVQAHPEWTVDQMREYLFASASDQIANGQSDPLFIRGYGLTNALGAYLLDYCPADFNQDGGIDGSDVESFFLTWETGSSGADTNEDGGVDGADVERFFDVWSVGGC